MDNDYKSHFEVYTVKQDTDETRSLSFDSRRRSRQQIFSEMPFHKFLIVVVGYYTSREISVQCLGAYRLNYRHKSQEYFEDTCGHHRSIRCVEEVIQKPPWHNAESLIVVGWLEKAFYCLYESSTSSMSLPCPSLLPSLVALLLMDCHSLLVVSSTRAASTSTSTASTTSQSILG